MRFVDGGEAISAVTGESRPARLAVCEECDGETFKVFLIEGKHQHLECATCGTSYCDGSCEDLGQTP